jgi:hypothetical protein
MTVAPSAMTSRHSSETAEHYTPKEVVQFARYVLGDIDLDPASSAEANDVIGATRIFTEADNGYLKPWAAARVFLNPPGGWCDVLGQRVIKARTKDGVQIGGCTVTGACGLPPGHAHTGIDSSQKRWWEKLAGAWYRREVLHAFFVCFSIELLQSTQVDTPQGTPLPLAFPICYPARRLAYWKPGGKVGSSPPHASCLVLLTNDDDNEMATRFVDMGHAKLGAVVTPTMWPPPRRRA